MAGDQTRAPAGADLPPDDPALSLAPLGMARVSSMSVVANGMVGQFVGAALFLDVSGFTSLSERLGALGSAGTEELVRILNGFFGPAIDLVRESGGELAAFGGDAITAVWPGEDSLTVAAACAEELLSLAREGGRLETSAGDFALGVRIGVATGLVDVVLGGSTGRSLLLTRGEAIHRAVRCEHTAALNHVVSLAGKSGRPLSLPTRAEGHLPVLDPGRFAHPVVVERVRRGDTTLIDGHRRVTSLFAGLTPGQGSTETLATLPTLVRSFVDIVGHLGGEVIQVTDSDKGTAALATFGAPTSSPDDACRAVAAGRQLVEERPDLSVGVGTGSVFAGLIGGSLRREYTVIGEAVNRAARLMQLAPAGTVLVDEATATAARSGFAFADPEGTRLKGSTQSITMRRLTGERGRIWPANRLAADGPMVGREAQLTAAEEALEPRSAGVHRVVIRGVAGLGKSRLSRAVAERAAARGWRVLAGGFVSVGDAMPYRAWQPVLNALLAGSPELGDELDRLLPGYGELAPILGPILGRNLPETHRSSTLAGEMRSELAEELAASVVEAAAMERPILIVLEDWHWADAASARLLTALSGRPMSTPVTLLITERLPVDATLLEDRPADTVLELGELGDDVTRELAASALARTGRTADAGWVDRIVELGGGNPLIVESLIEVGDESALTAGLAPLLQARLDGLPDDELRMLLWASAFGRPVVADELDLAMTFGSAASGGPCEERRSDSLDRLVSGGLLVSIGSAEASPLGFRHASIAEAAYVRLSHESRRDIHHAVARTVEERGGHAVEIAHHLLQTSDVARQAHWFPAAGDEARSAWAVEDAILWYDRARALGDVSDGLRINLADLLMVRGEHARVAALLLRPCEEPGLERRRLSRTGELQMVTGAPAAAVATLGEAFALTEHSGSAVERGASAELFARVLIEIGQLDEAAAVTRQTMEGLDQPDHDTRARLLGSYGIVQICRHELGDARDTLRRAVAEAELGDDRVRLVHLRSDLAAACAMSGDVVAALVEMLAAREVAGGIGYRRHLALSLGNEAELRMQFGDANASAVLALKGLEAAVALGDTGLACNNLLRLASNPSLQASDRRAIHDPAARLEAGLHRPGELLEFQVVGIEIAAAEGADQLTDRAQDVLKSVRAFQRADLELRLMLTLGEEADLRRVAELREDGAEPGDLFLLDVVERRVTKSHSEDADLLRRGLDVYGRTPFASYRDALVELGVKSPTTQVHVPARVAAIDDPPYSRALVLDQIAMIEMLDRTRSL